MKIQSQPNFFLFSRDFEPAYLNLYRTGELQQRSSEAHESLAACRLCPRHCRVNRLTDETAVCKTGRYAIVNSYAPHFGEENCLRGWRGSGTIFFARCVLRCQFCQNYEISHEGRGKVTYPEQLAAMMLELQSKGCHNINLVTPEHVVPQILEALVFAVAGGLCLPLVYNTSAYDSLESLQLLDDVVDIYMPDFKIWDSQQALKYLSARNYPEVARRAIKEMHRQVGDLKLDEHGMAKRGLLLRHLVIPGMIAGTREIMRFLSHEVSLHTYVNIMAQYYPAGKVSAEKYPELNRCITQQEYISAFTSAQKAGLYRFER